VTARKGERRKGGEKKGEERDLSLASAYFTPLLRRCKAFGSIDAGKGGKRGKRKEKKGDRVVFFFSMLPTDPCRAFLPSSPRNGARGGGGRKKREGKEGGGGRGTMIDSFCPSVSVPYGSEVIRSVSEKGEEGEKRGKGERSRPSLLISSIERQ